MRTRRTGVQRSKFPALQVLERCVAPIFWLKIFVSYQLATGVFFWKCTSEVLTVLRMSALPYKIATLLYAFNERDEVLLLERAQEPNRGLWSPPGGKLKTESGEAPHACAARELGEELGVCLAPTDFHLTGLVSEHGYAGQAHWLMFLFEVGPRLRVLPPPHREGRFAFWRRDQLTGLALPATDRDRIWPLFWQHRRGFFAAHCHCHADGRYDWSVMETRAFLEAK